MIDNAEQVERQSRRLEDEAAVAASAASSSATAARMSAFDPDQAEMTVIRIRTADAFSLRNDQSISMARSVIDRFEEEETRMAQLSAPQLAQLRAGERPRRDSAEVPPPAPRGEGRPRRITDDPTTMRSLGIDDRDVDGIGEPTEPPNSRYDPDEATRLVAPLRERRTPMPERSARGTQNPPPGPPPSGSRPQPTQPPPSASRRQPEPPPEISPSSTLPIGQVIVQPQPPKLPPQPAPPPPKPHPGFLTTQAPAPRVAPVAPTQYPPDYVPPPAPTGYPMFNPPGVASSRLPRAVTPTTPEALDWPLAKRPASAQRTAPPQVAGFSSHGQPPVSPLRPWMLVVGALIMAGLAFALTRAFIH